MRSKEQKVDEVEVAKRGAKSARQRKGQHENQVAGVVHVSRKTSKAGGDQYFTNDDGRLFSK